MVKKSPLKGTQTKIRDRSSSLSQATEATVNRDARDNRSLDLYTPLRTNPELSAQAKEHEPRASAQAEEHEPRASLS